ncbi:MAG: uracil-DNA glycosylase [Candidatus Shapirobacteria bacterium]
MNKAVLLKEIADKIGHCQLCPLYKQATNPVPGEGNSEAQIVFIGEAPGYWEDQKGIPFCGAAGNLLNKLLSEINLKRDEVFIGNILKHRPPNNRDPLPNEIKACTPYLKEQLLIIKPKIIITLGRFAMNYFLPGAYISHTHGQLKKITWQELNLFLYPLYHPAAALRNGQVMNELRADFLKIPQILKNSEGPPPAPQPAFQPKQENLF